VAVLLTLYLMSLYEVFLRRSGALARLTHNFIKMLGDYRLTSVVMPLLVATPSPGGARFSAPLVAETLENSAVSNQEKAFINFWFRHIWEPILPVIPRYFDGSHAYGHHTRPLSPDELVHTTLMIVVGWV